MQPPITPPTGTKGAFVVRLYTSLDEQGSQFWITPTLSDAIGSLNSWMTFAHEMGLPVMGTIRGKRTGVLLHRAVSDEYAAKFNWHEPAIMPGVPS